MTSGRHRGEHNKETRVCEQRLIEIFRDKTFPHWGLTKMETISTKFNIPLAKLRTFPKEKIDAYWTTIQYTKKILRKEKQMVIVQTALPAGTVLRANEQFPERQLTDRTYVYYRCTKIEDALIYASKLSKVARGYDKASEEVMESVEEEIEQAQVLEVANGRQTQG